MKKILLFLISIFMIITLSGCEKAKIDSKKFEEIVKSNGYEVVDDTENYEEYEIFKQVMIATNKNDLKIAYYKFNSVDDAESTFNSTKYELKGKKKGISGYIEISLFNYSKYSLSTGGNYYYICRIDDTIIYTQTYSNLKKDAKDIVKKLGY